MRQFIAFSMVGTLGFFLDAGTLYFVHYVLGVSLYAGRVISYFVAASGTWALNRGFTFKLNNSEKKIHKEWSQYIILNGFGGGINYLCYASWVAYAEWGAEYPIIGVALGSIVGLVFNFTASKNIVFKAPS